MSLDQVEAGVTVRVAFLPRRAPEAHEGPSGLAMPCTRRARWRATLVVAAALLGAACSGARSPAHAPACDPVERGDHILAFVNRAPSEEPSAPAHDGRIAADGRRIPGPPSADAVEAKRLFDAGRWAEASELLKRVARGKAGDDEGNRELAEFDLAIALDHLKPGDGVGVVLSILVKPYHLKGEDAALWLWRYLQRGPTSVRLAKALLNENFPPEADCRDRWPALMSLVGKLLLRGGHREEAAAILARRPGDSACLDLLCDDLRPPAACRERPGTPR